MFTSPLPLNTALREGAVKALLPVGTRAKLSEEVQAPLLRRSTFLAAESQAETLQRVNDGILDVVRGSDTETEQLSKLRRLTQILTDGELAKEYRLRLILDTNIDLSRGFGGWLQSQDDVILDEFPAWEFYRAEYRKEPRDWPARWEDAGGEFYPGSADYPEGRMIALKTDPIWTEISRFGTPYAPFDFNSGMDLRDVDRAECLRLGLITEGEPGQAPERAKFNEDFAATPELAGALAEAFGSFVTSAGLGATLASGAYHLGELLR